MMARCLPFMIRPFLLFGEREINEFLLLLYILIVFDFISLGFLIVLLFRNLSVLL